MTVNTGGAEQVEIERLEKEIKEMDAAQELVVEAAKYGIDMLQARIQELENEIEGLHEDMAGESI